MIRVPTVLCKLLSPGTVSLVLRWPCARPAQSVPSDHTGAHFEANKQVSTVSLYSLFNRAYSIPMLIQINQSILEPFFQLSVIKR